jgi:hypothetical protein
MRGKKIRRFVNEKMQPISGSRCQVSYTQDKRITPGCFMVPVETATAPDSCHPLANRSGCIM